MIKPPDHRWWEQARQARDKLEALVIHHPAVSMVDIGRAPAETSGTPVLRVHVRSNDLSSLDLPRAIDNIPVEIIHGDYDLDD